MSRDRKLHIVLMHDWLTGMRGGEHCLEVICRAFAAHEIEIVTAFFRADKIPAEIARYVRVVSWANYLPGVRHYYRFLLPFYPLIALELSLRLALRHRRHSYDLAVSVSHCLVKNIKLPAHVPHICYCLSPMRYIWDQFDRYFTGRSFKPVASAAAFFLRRWDRAGARRVTGFIAISEFVRQRIIRVYGRDSSVVFPPVKTERFVADSEKRKGSEYLCVSALVPYKNIHLIVEAFNRLQRPLLIVGSGPEKSRLQQLAGPSIRFAENLSDEALSSAYRQARAFVFAAEEDFGMTPVEAQWLGLPVIAYAGGGTKETVIASGPGMTGVLFSELTADAISRAVTEFESKENSFSARALKESAERFSEELFLECFYAAMAEAGFPPAFWGRVSAQMNGEQEIRKQMNSAGSQVNSAVSEGAEQSRFADVKAEVKQAGRYA